MARITVKDLPQSDDLDRQAMRSITGGGRIDVRLAPFGQAKVSGGRIVDYPPGFGRQGRLPAKLQHPGT